MKRDTVVIVLAFIISGVWAVSAIGSLVTKEYTSLSIITPVMLIVTGFLFAVGRNGGNGK